MKTQKKDKNITTILTFQDMVDIETGEIFMSVGGTVIKRHVDEDGIEIMDNEGNVEYTKVDFMMTATELNKKLPEMIRKLSHEALELHEQEKDKTKED